MLSSPPLRGGDAGVPSAAITAASTAATTLSPVAAIDVWVRGVWGLAGAGEWREGRSASRGPLPPLGEARRASAASLPTMSPRTGGLSPTAHKTNKNPAYSSRSLARAGGDPVLLPYPSFGLSVFFLSFYQCMYF